MKTGIRIFMVVGLALSFLPYQSLRPVHAQGQAKITICHIPPGNPENKHEITVSQAALPAHLAHGDTIGQCSGGPLPQ